MTIKITAFKHAPQSRLDETRRMALSLRLSLSRGFIEPGSEAEAEKLHRALAAFLDKIGAY